MADIKEKIPDTAVFVAVAESIQNDVQVNEYLECPHEHGESHGASHP